MKPSADTANPPTKPLSRAERKALLLAELEQQRVDILVQTNAPPRWSNGGRQKSACRLYATQEA